MGGIRHQFRSEGKGVLARLAVEFLERLRGGFGFEDDLALLRFRRQATVRARRAARRLIKEALTMLIPIPKPVQAFYAEVFGFEEVHRLRIPDAAAARLLQISRASLYERLARWPDLEATGVFDPATAERLQQTAAELGQASQPAATGTSRWSW